jgi:alanyl-tRNA synthetase
VHRYGSGAREGCVSQDGVNHVFATDILKALVAEIETLSQVPYRLLDNGPSFHVIADHIRSLAFAIADGAQPSNTDRGYVLRKILRRAVRYGKQLGFQKPFLGKLLPTLIQMMGDDFPELPKAKHRIEEIVTLEEEHFFRTLSRGVNLFTQVVERAQRGVISGEDAFKLKDTYGLPLEEITLMAKDEHLTVDLEGFHQLEAKAKDISKASHTLPEQTVSSNLFAHLLEKHPPIEFLGYHHRTTEADVIALLVDGAFVSQIASGKRGQMILHRTPFYAEKGGQVGDTGHFTFDHGSLVVHDTQSPYPGIVTHTIEVEQGSIRVGTKGVAVVNPARREAIAANHTATHLLHFALEEVLGPHIRQAGSLVDPERLRLDFSHHKALASEELQTIEDLVNEKIRQAFPVSTYSISLQEAQERPDIKQFFGDKYGQIVRVVDIDFSKELCGGTHAPHTGVIGLFKILKEYSVAKGVRRIEAVTGKHAHLLIRQERELIDALAKELKCPPTLLKEKISSLIEEKKKLELSLQEKLQGELQRIATGLITHLQSCSFGHFIVAKPPVSMQDLAPLMELLLKEPCRVVVLGQGDHERCQIMVGVTPDLVLQGLKAKDLIQSIAPVIEGGGGGKDTLAQAGGKRPEGLGEALRQMEEALGSRSLS